VTALACNEQRCATINRWTVHESAVLEQDFDDVEITALRCEEECSCASLFNGYNAVQSINQSEVKIYDSTHHTLRVHISTLSQQLRNAGSVSASTRQNQRGRIIL
jgi:hypothetical protein